MATKFSKLAKLVPKVLEMEADGRNAAMRRRRSLGGAQPENMRDKQDIELLEAFTAKNGRRTVMFYFQEVEIKGPEDIGRVYPGNVSKGTMIQKVFATDGHSEGLTGQCIYLIRCTTDEIVPRNMTEVVSLGSFSAESKPLLSSLQDHLAKIYVPAVKAYRDWGDLSTSPSGLSICSNFMDHLDGFINSLESAKQSVEGTIQLQPCDTSIGLHDINTVQDCIAAASKPDVVSALENLVDHWCRQIEQVLTESSQMRKEADDTGPLAELEHWRQLTARFNSLLEQIKSKDCCMAIRTLHVAKSKTYKTWKEQDCRITDGANEAKNNLRFLYTLEKYCEPLYRCDPVAMAECVPSLINVIRMIYGVSSYYNTSERMTSLFSKVTNQMVKTCKAYITEDGMTRVWEQDSDVISNKIKVCLNLYNSYQSTFQRCKKSMEENPDEKPFDFSEMYIFGKFEAFCKRLEMIAYVVRCIETYSVIQSCRIEGIEPIVNKFQLVVNGIKKKPYDTLDHRKRDFDYDYEDFKRSIHDMDSFLDLSFDRAKSTIQALTLLNRFASLSLGGLGIVDKYRILFARFGQEVEVVRNLYEANCQNPPIPRDMPPVAGKIQWVRQMSRRLQEPMELFKEKNCVMTTHTGKKVIANYNKTMKAFLEFEILYHRAWIESVNYAHQGTVSSAGALGANIAIAVLQVPVLVKVDETGELLVNLDSGVMLITRETECMRRMGLQIPEDAITLLHQAPQIMDNRSKLQLLLNENSELRQQIPSIFLKLMKPVLCKVDGALNPGLSTLTWTSLNIPEFFSSIKVALAELKTVVKQVMDIKGTRIDDNLKEISEMQMCDLPDCEPWTMGEFLERSREHAEQCAQDMDHCSEKIEEAVNDLIAIFRDRAISSPEFLQTEHTMTIHQHSTVSASNDNQAVPLTIGTPLLGEAEAWLQENCEELFLHFKHRCTEAMLRATKLSLDLIRKRISFHGRGMVVKECPFFKTEMTLAIPNIEMKPSLDDLQAALNAATQQVLDIPRGVALWGQSRFEMRSTAEGGTDTVARRKKVDDDVQMEQVRIPPQNIMNFYKSVSEHKDVAKVAMMLSSSLSTFRTPISNSYNMFSHFSFLWDQEREDVVKEFVETNPTLSDFRAEIHKYEAMVEEVDEYMESNIIGGVIELFTEPLKNALKIEIVSWKMLFGKRLNLQYKSKMDEIADFEEDMSRKLSHPIKDLEDVRQAMLALDIVKQKSIEIDMTLGPIEECYTMLQKFGVRVEREEMEKVDTLRYSFVRLMRTSNQLQDNLVEVQPTFKTELLDAIETFRVDNEMFEKDYELMGPMVDGISPQEASDRLGTFQTRFDDMWRRFGTYSAGEELFGLPTSEYNMLQRVKKELNLLQKLYGLYNAVMKTVDGYYDYLWVEVDIEKMNADLVDFQNRCRKLPKALKDWQAFMDLKQKVDDFNECCPLLELMANKAMKERHWQRLEQATNCRFAVDSEDFKLRSIMEAPLLKVKEDIEDICISAVKEKDIEAKLKQVIQDWSNQDLTFANFKARGELLLKGSDTSEIVMLMEDSLMILGSLLSNRYNAPFKKQIQDWVQKLSNTSDIIENWLVVQNLWVYLEAVFVGGDIAKQLPQEAKRFGNIDKSWVKIMTRAHEQSNVVKCCVGDETMGQLLPHLLEQLEVCQKSLTGYLESKRLIFPRFFFVSDPALLEILGQASDSHTIQAHLLGIFENLAEVEFHEKDYDRILAAKSREGEVIPLEKPVHAKGNVEMWLGELLDLQQSSLHSIIKEAYVVINDASFDLLGFLSEYIAQVGLLGIQMLWTRDAEEALSNARADKKIMQNTNKHFLDILNLLIEQTTRDLTKFERVKFETLVTIHVHQRDIFDDLTRLHIKTPNDFEWLKQARFYYKDDNDKIICSITDIDFAYQNEFLGCTDRLVITPLTDRCYITLSQALGMSMGGAPAGPAGTGKTETVKDMGKALGKYVVVFNCSDQMDFRGLGRIYKGLAQSGSWGCFDEFNRIELPVLSVAAQQIYICLTAKKERKPFFIFSDGDNVSLNPEFGFFLTMNPGYAGRQELPENLKVQFRSVAMMVPDRQIIMRVKLASCGFQENVILSRKFFVLYKLCEEQLSKQIHYDFGLRNILSVLRTLGAQKRTRLDETEYTIMMRVLRDMNLSKLVDEDEPLFLSLISDLFPGITLESATNLDLQTAIASAIEENKLVDHPPWNLKVNQLYDTQNVRHGLMTLGPSGAGKTCCIKVLQRAMTLLGSPHREMRMNPKAITAPQMFGRLDAATNDWTDGIFSTLWRRTLKSKKGDHVWIILDGPVDAVWIENLNSVLDDNKTLTLANGDRIVMSPSCKLLFEVHCIDNASPATVSRVGMVFMSASALDWRPILMGWLNKRNPQEADVLLSLFDQVFYDLFEFAEIKLFAKMTLLQSMQIKQACDLLEGLIPTREDKGVLPAAHLERLFIFSLMWSVGALMELDDREKIQKFLLDHPAKLKYPELKGDQTIFEFVVSDNGEWEHWNNRVEEYIYPKDSIPNYLEILVPNVDNIRTNFLIETVAKQEKAVLLIGEQGTAKTVMIKGYTSGYNPDFHLTKSFNFSSATTPNMVQRIIEGMVDKRMGTTYGPPGGRKMTVFIDDINMPIINEWGDQITNEITRQCMEIKGFYSLDKPGEFLHVVDLQFMGAMIHPGGGRNDIPQRLKRQFCVFNCTLPSNASIDKIFGIIGNGYFCPERDFTPEVCETIEKLVPATRILWQLTKIKMLPTPAKFHYVFNLRDLSRIWEGVLHVQAPECTNIGVTLGLWKHECMRVIADRFTNPEDKHWFEMCLGRVVNEHLGPEYFSELPKEPFFVDFLRDAPEPTGEEQDDADLEAPKIYEQIPSLDLLKARLMTFMQSYNDTIRGANMDLVFFKDAMVHVIKISRVIRTPRGNALLVGVGGSGKQSLTRLAAFIAGYSVFQITLTRTYNVNNLMDDLKVLYRTTGVKGEGLTFIFTDNEIKDEAFLEYLNNILSSGEIANLFPRDEVDEICNELIGVMKKEFPRRPPTAENLYEYFISRASNNLHCVLCFSPVGEKFRNRSLKFPGLISGCTMDWFERWPRDALIAVAHHFLEHVSLSCPPETKVQLVEMMGVLHDGVAQSCLDYFDRFRRVCHVTPKSYLSFIDGYIKIYNEKVEVVGELARRMNLGLEKLMEATVSVDQLSKELVVKEKELAVANKKADKVLVEVTASATAAEKVKAEVQKVKDKAQAVVDEIADVKAIAEEKLEAARPALEEAESALQTIKPAHISTVRKLGKPPHLIMRIMDCVLLLFQKKVDPVVADPEKPCCKPSWSESLKLMSNSGFLPGLMNFPKDTINEETVELLAPYLHTSMNDYNLESAKKVCGDVAGLCSWTQAMSFFYGINKEVLPLKANLAKQEARLQIATRELDSAQATLDEKQRELDIVQATYDSAMAEKQVLLDDAESCRMKMEAASALIGGLGGEKVRWTAQSKAFAAQISRLIGDVVICTGFLSYCGPFNQEFRNRMRNNWEKNMNKRSIPFSDDFNLTSSLADNATIGEWNLQGLPTDDLSIQNGIITTKATRYPLLIDPQGQGKSWIKNREKNRELQVTALNHKYFRTHLEDALSLGRPLLLEDIEEELDPALDNVLEKNFIKSGSSYKVKVGDKECDVMSDFYLYITTKLPNPSYTPEISARTAIIDFTVTQKGLEDQLLGRVILAEKSELECERTKLMEDVTANKRKMQELEANLLFKLTSTKGSLVEDESLIQVLAVTKETAAEVSEKLAVAAETEARINEAREEFRPVANRGSILYFLICEMSMVNVMYQTSLGQFLGIFDISMDRSEKSPVTTKRIHNIIEYLTYEVFRYTCRGLYENHKFLFTLLLTLKIDLQRENVNGDEFQSFIKGGAALDLKAVQPKPCKWITDMTWLNLVDLSKLPQFNDILNQIPRNEKGWRAWFDKDAPEEEATPDGYSSSLDTFRKLLLIRAWCPDRTIAQARKYIASSIGKRYADAVILDLDGMLNESIPKTPMICLLSQGSDPTSQIENLAKKLGRDVRSISMGQGQEVHARRQVSQFMASGGWVLLQNCHLALAYMEELLETLIEAENLNDNFRVWITTEEHKNFPISLLQVSIKFTNEPPMGIKAGLKRTYAGISQDLLDVNSLTQWKPMLYAVSFLHTVVQERRKFGPLGWNIPYEFNPADWYASMQFMQNHLDDIDPKRGVSWSTVRYMLGEVQYGGRVTDDYDKRLLNTFAKVWFGEHMFQPTFCFYKGYSIPTCKKIEEYMQYIEDMPMTDSPEAFGLHPNADITYQSNTANQVLDTIMNIQPKDAASGGGETRESVVFRQASEMLEKLPPDYQPHEVRDRLKKMGLLQPLNIFLRQELDRMQCVITEVRSTLMDLQLAIEGTIIMSENLRDALDNMFDARVPRSWKRVSWQSSTLGFWFTELLERNEQFNRWIFESRPTCFWMTGFFNPQGFLTAMRQEVTRAHKGWSLDSVMLYNDITKFSKEDITSSPTEGVYVHGLYLEGASWDRRNGRLADPQPKVLFSVLPIVHIYAIQQAPLDTRLYQCPVYKKPQRTDLTYITFLVMRTTFNPDNWVLRGVAALCDVK